MRSAVILSTFLLAASAHAADVRPTVEASVGLGTPTGFVGALGGVRVGEHFAAAAGVGYAPGGAHVALHADGVPFVFRRVSLGVRGSASIGNLELTNCSPGPCGATLHVERRWEMQWKPAVFLGLAVLFDVRLSKELDFGLHAGVSKVVNVSSGTCTYDITGNGCANVRDSSWDDTVLGDLGLSLRYSFDL